MPNFDEMFKFDPYIVPDMMKEKVEVCKWHEQVKNKKKIFVDVEAEDRYGRLISVIGREKFMNNAFLISVAFGIEYEEPQIFFPDTAKLNEMVELIKKCAEDRDYVFIGHNVH